MINYKLKNLKQFNLNCELIMKFLNKIDTIMIEKTNCVGIKNIFLNWHGINFKIGNVEIYKSKERWDSIYVKFIIKETNFSEMGAFEVEATSLIFNDTDRNLQKICKFLNEHIRWKV